MEPPRPPDPDRVARFCRALEPLWPQARGSLALAISGGPDSLALLLLAAAARPGGIAAATVDHGLRAESAAEAAMVGAVCARLGVPHAVLPVTLAPGNVQAEARSARYAAMAGWMAANGHAALATAHHADDQAETLLMRLNRASGVAGLAGVRELGQVPGSALPLVRPLLGWRRSELAAVVEQAGLIAAQDPSNHDAHYDRVRVRARLAQADWLDPAALAASAAHLADADAALDWAARREWSECVSREGLGLCYRPQAPRAVALRVLARVVAELGGEAPRGSALARLFDGLIEGRTSSIGALVARPSRDGWHFMAAPKRRSESL